MTRTENAKYPLPFCPWRVLQKPAQLCREGADSKACKALYSPGLLDPNAVRAEMAAKHPPAQVPDLSGLGASNVGLVPAVTADDIRASVAFLTGTLVLVLPACDLCTSRKPWGLPLPIRFLII